MSTWLARNQEWLDRARAKWAPRRDDRLRLRCWLASPVCWDPYNGLTLEGALQYAVVVRETGEMPDDVFCGCDVPTDIQVPLTDETLAGRAIACASWAQAPENAIESLRMRRRRTRVETFGKGKVDTACAEYKSLNHKVHTLTTPYLDFFVRGDADKLRDLLADVSSLGQNRSHGLGLVHGWEVDDDADDRALVYQRKPQRAIPVESDYDAAIAYECGGYDLRETQTRAPYWKRDARCLAAVPVC